MSFLVRPFPKRNEHLLAFMMRVSWLNHMRCLQDLLFTCELEALNNRIAYRKLVTGLFDVDVLAHRLHLDISLLEDNTIDIAPSRTIAFGCEFPNDMLNFSHPKLCRQCFEDMGYIPFSSAMVPLTACPKHRCELTTHWQDGKQLGWGERDIWTRLNETPLDVSAASDDAVELSRLIIRLSRGVPNTTLPEPFHLLSLFALLLLLRFLVKFDPRISGGRGIRHASAYAWTHAYSILRAWPESMSPLFTHCEIMGTQSNIGHGLRATFCDVYDELYAGSYRNSYAYSCLQKAFETFVQSPDTATQLWSPNHKLLPSECVKNMPCKQAMQMLGLRKRELERLVNLELLGEVTQTNGGVRLLTKSNVHKFASERHYFINLCELCNRMEISRSVAVQLISAGLLPCIAQPDKEYRDWLFDTQQISNFVQQLEKNSCQVVSKKGNAPHAPLRNLHFRGKSTPDIVAGMLAGKVKFTFHPDKKRLLSLNQFHPVMTDKLDFSHLGYLIPKQVTRLLGINLNAVYDLAKKITLIVRWSSCLPILEKSVSLPQHQLAPSKLSMF